MTIAEAIREADRLKPNSFPTEDKLRWLERLELRLREEILERCEGTLPAWSPFETGDLSRALQVPAPFDEIYVHWLCAQMDYYEREYEGFNASNAMFEALFRRFRNAYNREHRPRTGEKHFQ